MYHKRPFVGLLILPSTVCYQLNVVPHGSPILEARTSKGRADYFKIKFKGRNTKNQVSSSKANGSIQDIDRFLYFQSTVVAKGNHLRKF